jgi:hypothetical protein
MQVSPELIARAVDFSFRNLPRTDYSQAFESDSSPQESWWQFWWHFVPDVRASLSSSMQSRKSLECL